MNQPEILIIGVIYNTYRETLRYLASIASCDTSNITLILADNSQIAQPKDFSEKIKSYPFLHYFETGKNLGYFGGAKEGLNYYLREHSTLPPWILVTNVDIVFTPEFFTRLIAMNPGENLGVVAPAIISQKWKTDYNPKITVRCTKRKIQRYQVLYSNYLIHNLFLTAAYAKKWINGRRGGKSAIERHPADDFRKIYAAHGSCMVFRDTYFTRGGNLNLPNFLFGEEIFVAETAARLNLEVIYNPDLVINDYEHASIGFFLSPKMNHFYKESNQVILDHYYSSPRNEG